MQYWHLVRSQTSTIAQIYNREYNARVHSGPAIRLFFKVCFSQFVFHSCGGMIFVKQVWQKRLLVILGALWLTLWMPLPGLAAPQILGLPLAQTSVDDLQTYQQRLEHQKSQVAAERDRLQNLEGAAQQTLQGLQRGLKTTTKTLQTQAAQLQTETQRLKQLEVQLVAAEQAYGQKRSSTIARLQFLQRQHRNQGWAVLLQSQSVNEFLDRRYQLKRVHQADQHTLISLKTEAEQLDQQRDRLEQTKTRITLLTQQLAAQKGELEKLAVDQKSSVARLKSDRRAMEVAEVQLEQDSRAIASLINQRLAQGERIAFRGTGQMLLPVIGEITSSFGWRVHPVLGYERFHAGLDVGADYGTLIHAAERGTVIFAGWYGGYGNAVIIDHGGTITTLYAHASELYVTEGQSVQRGQAIAAVGSTGLSTGPHLHFEVRRDGEPTDPVAFL
ncbi:MAG: peptidoglycan DD-metalloendopeptidase family protein [Leptolyngbyaceae cyanobacterium bins.349]|nr:peptidoglycan DD-metalloendopeptidase family protein [Leptolyngbyaceae cyanobacterium bins.349]